MPAELSVIIPTLNAQDDLPECLSCLMEGVTGGLIRELIISDGGSTDATKIIAEDVGAVLVTGPPSRGGQLQRGASRARGSWLLIVHADTELAPGWSVFAGNHMTKESGKAAHFSLGFRAKGFGPRWVEGWANFRSRMFSLPYGDQGLLVSRKIYEQVGGYRDQPLMEDVSLVRALPGPLVCIPIQAMTSAIRYQEQGWVRRGARNLWTLARFFAGANPVDLAASYRR